MKNITHYNFSTISIAYRQTHCFMLNLCQNTQIICLANTQVTFRNTATPCNKTITLLFISIYTNSLLLAIHERLVSGASLRCRRRFAVRAGPAGLCFLKHMYYQRLLPLPTWTYNILYACSYPTIQLLGTRPKL